MFNYFTCNLMTTCDVFVQNCTFVCVVQRLCCTIVAKLLFLALVYILSPNVSFMICGHKHVSLTTVLEHNCLLIAVLMVCWDALKL